MTDMVPEVRDLAFVPRWGIIRTIRHQNVAEHSYFVTVMVNDIVDVVNSRAPAYHIPAQARNDMLAFALFHDLSEAVTGDITGPIKNRIVDRKKYDEFIVAKERQILGRSPTAMASVTLAPHELFIVKLADFLEAILFVMDEIKLGNTLLDLKTSLMNTLHRILEDAVDTFDGSLVTVLREYVDATIVANQRTSRINEYDVVKP